ncbi:MAG: S24 family peptidase, partial [Mariprofundaceae bacterium]
MEYSFQARMKICADRAGDATKLADMAGVSRRVIGKYLAGDSDPSRERLVSISKAGRVSIEWLATGEGPIHRESITPPDDESNGAYTDIPLYDVHAAAWHGAVVESENIVDMLSFKREWLERELHAQPVDLYLIHVDGESMEPTLRPGDVILVDRRAADQLPRDGIYVMRMENTLLVKRLQ